MKIRNNALAGIALAATAALSLAACGSGSTTGADGKPEIGRASCRERG